MSNPESLARFLLEADPDPLLPGRVLGLFALRGDLPRRFASELTAAGTLRVEVDFATDDVERARYLARKLLTFSSVRGVDLTLRRTLARAA